MTELAAAIEETIAGDLTQDERAWVSRIEALRGTLEQDATPVSITDYGAGKPTANLMPEQMSHGVLRATTTGQACRASKPYFWSLLLFKLVRKFQPAIGVELGTCLGISAAYQAAAQRLNGSGRFVTLEGAPALAALAQNNLRALSLHNATVVNGRFIDTLERTLSGNAPIEYVFVDGHHDEHATIAYWNTIWPYLVDGSIVVVDDIAWSTGMRKAWRHLQNDDRIACSINLRTLGICFVKVGCQKHHLALRLPTHAFGTKPHRIPDARANAVKV